MAMPALARRWTREDIRAFPEDGNRYELVAGELLVTPAPRMPHQDAVLALVRVLDPFIRGYAIGHLMASPADLEIRPGEWYQPDLFVVPLNDGRRPRDWNEIRTPRLVIEVSSPSTARYDRVVKRPAFQDAGVEEFWIIDLDARLVERWRPTDARPEILVPRLIWQPEGARQPLDIDLVAFFSGVLD